MYKSKLKLLRIKRGMTLEELSELSGVSTGYLCHLEKRDKEEPFY